MDKNDNVRPKVHKVKGRWQETARDLVLFPLLKIVAFVLALIVMGLLSGGQPVPYEPW